MAEAAFSKTHPVDTTAFTRSEDTPGIMIRERRDLAMVQLFAKSKKTTSVVRKLKLSKVAGKASNNDGFVAMPLAPGQWMLVGEAGQGPGFGEKVAGEVDGIGYVSEQSGARACFRVSGERVREFMERCCRLDLHPSKAAAGFCAQTQMAQIGVLIHQVSDEPAYDLFVFSGFAQDFAEWLVHTAEKYGLNYSVE